MTLFIYFWLLNDILFQSSKKEVQKIYEGLTGEQQLYYQLIWQLFSQYINHVISEIFLKIVGKMPTIDIKLLLLSD